MKQVLYRQGQALVEQVPVPQADSGYLLVRVDHSAISIGTELSGMRSSAVPVWKRAIQKPHLIKRAFQFASTNGIGQTRRLVREKSSALLPIGYSAAGIVEDAGKESGDFQPGDRVACAGAQCAFHAEYIRVPVNLTVPVPENVPFSHAATVALGAIALQGVRRAEPTLGETFVVLGLGILGQMTTQILRANGCKVIGADLDRNRVETGIRHGMNFGIDPQGGNQIEQAMRMTGGVGADGVIITAATPSSAVVSSAFNMCRRKGRVVLVGDVGLDFNRADLYEKELDFRISTSYGPGRYDEHYEEHGLDYPIGYVRWTENRNMQAWLQLLSQKAVHLDELISAVYPVEQAAEAYEQIRSCEPRPLLVLLKYPQPAENPLHNGVDNSPSSGHRQLTRKVINPSARASGSGQIRIAVVGAGAFARAMHLPNLQSLADRFHLQAVCSQRGHNAAALSRQYQANYATTDYDQILNDDEVDTVLICTRHNHHAQMVLQALQAGKHVLVEKPLALTQDELSRIEEFYASQSTETLPLLLTGFNRRFAPAIRFLRETISKRTNPLMINYVMNAGYVPQNHWVHSEEGGGRNRGEACHIYDLFTCLTNSRALRISAHHVKPTTQHYRGDDNFVATISYEDGSVATLTYTALGSPKHSKEQMQVFADGRVISLDDYRNLSVDGSRNRKVSSRFPDKGHKQELAAFADTIQQGGHWPIPLWQQVQTTETALSVEQLLRTQH